jgi:Fe-S cluster biogenesis protein NfuA
MTGADLIGAVEAGLQEIRPFLQRDKGDIELVSIEDDKFVKKHAPQIETVVDISGEKLEEDYRDTIEL